MMFDPQDKPRVFQVPLGADFPHALVAGLMARSQNRPPEELARTEIIVNTTRMQRRMRSLFDAGPPLLLPDIKLITQFADLPDQTAVPPAASPLRRRLELIQLVAGLIDRQPDLAPKSSLFDLSDSLADLMDEMQGEGVSPDKIAGLDVSDQSGHWQRAKQFIQIVQTYFDNLEHAPDKEARQRMIVQNVIGRWSDTPPQHPVIIAGSTGSRGTTLMLMEAVAKLPQGALILPGFDDQMPAPVWEQLKDALTSEDHPQYRFYKLMQNLDLCPDDIQEWHKTDVASPDRNALVSLALRPAPVTNAWLLEGPGLPDLVKATNEMTLVLAPSPRDEALAIAMRLRQAAQTGQTAALITPDRMLTRQVAAALDRWNIIPDDSAGTPLQLSPPGRFLRHVAALFAHPLTTESLLTLLKHPLTHSGDDRNQHNLLTRDLELYLRRKGDPFPQIDTITKWVIQQDVSQDWLTWLTAAFFERQIKGDVPLSEWVARCRALAEHISDGPTPQSVGELWKKTAGREALSVFEDLEEQAPFGGDMAASDFGDLLGALLSQGVVRDRDAPHSGIMIWGTLEARVQGADLMILGGLNEGSWPEAPKPDPWLNRKMRFGAGLLLPERRIGLAAHDFQQAVSAKEVWLTRSIRSEDAETVASRWVNRLTNLIDGLPANGGKKALQHMTARGNLWLSKARKMEQAEKVDGANRPSPRPPVSARPRKLSVTEINTLIRDPFAVYAKHVLRLRPLNPVIQPPDARNRGIAIHAVVEQFIRRLEAEPSLLSKAGLMAVAQEVLEQEAPWPAIRAMWLARIERVADWFVVRETQRRQNSQPIAFEKQARGEITDDLIGFTLYGFADRIDRDADGRLRIYDYKAGKPPTEAEQNSFNKQLLLEAAMLEMGGFENVSPAKVAAAIYIGLGPGQTEVAAPLEKTPTDVVWADLRKLMAAYLQPGQGFTSRSRMKRDDDAGDYDQLARFGEWDHTSDPTPEDLT